MAGDALCFERLCRIRTVTNASTAQMNALWAALNVYVVRGGRIEVALSDVLSECLRGVTMSDMLARFPVASPTMQILTYDRTQREDMIRRIEQVLLLPE